MGLQAVPGELAGKPAKEVVHDSIAVGRVVCQRLREELAAGATARPARLWPAGISPAKITFTRDRSNGAGTRRQWRQTSLRCNATAEEVNEEEMRLEASERAVRESG